MNPSGEIKSFKLGEDQEVRFRVRTKKRTKVTLAGEFSAYQTLPRPRLLTSTQGINSK